MVAAPQPRKYDPRTDKAWSSAVYQAARKFLIGFPTETGKTSALFNEICSRFKDGHHALCDDLIAEKTQPRSPYWKHRVASALSTLKKTGVVSRGGGQGEWVWRGSGSATSATQSKPTPTPSTAPQVTPSGPIQPTPVVVPPHMHSLEDMLVEHERQVRATLRERLNNMDPGKFQREFCVTLLESLGYTDVHPTPPGPDLGIDGVAKQRGVVDTVVKYQAKRWGQQIGRPEIDKFRGAIQGSCHKGIFITTSTFSEDAKAAAMTLGGVPIEMIDGERIVNLTVEKRIGVREQPLTILRLVDL